MDRTAAAGERERGRRSNRLPPQRVMDTGAVHLLGRCGIPRAARLSRLRSSAVGACRPPLPCSSPRSRSHRDRAWRSTGRRDQRAEPPREVRVLPGQEELRPEHMPRTWLRRRRAGPGGYAPTSPCRSRSDPQARTPASSGSDHPANPVRRSGDGCLCLRGRSVPDATLPSCRSGRDARVWVAARSPRLPHQPVAQLLIVAETDQLDQPPVLAMVGRVQQVVLPVLRVLSQGVDHFGEGLLEGGSVRGDG